MYTPPSGASAVNSPPTSTCRYLSGLPTSSLSEFKSISLPDFNATFSGVSCSIEPTASIVKSLPAVILSATRTSSPATTSTSPPAFTVPTLESLPDSKRISLPAWALSTAMFSGVFTPISSPATILSTFKSPKPSI